MFLSNKLPLVDILRHAFSSIFRLLEEEFEKREELERLKEQQESILRAEREQKAVLESDRREQKRLLAQAQARLQQLECDKAAAAGKMQVQKHLD